MDPISFGSATFTVVAVLSQSYARLENLRGNVSKIRERKIFRGALKLYRERLRVRQLNPITPIYMETALDVENSTTPVHVDTALEVKNTSKQSRFSERNVFTAEEIELRTQLRPPTPTPTPTSPLTIHLPAPELESTTQLPTRPRKRLIRPCLVLIFISILTLAGSLTAGFYWSLKSGDLGGAWTMASFIAFVGGVPVTIAGSAHFQRCRCWSSDWSWN